MPFMGGLGQCTISPHDSTLSFTAVRDLFRRMVCMNKRLSAAMVAGLVDYGSRDDDVQQSACGFFGQLNLSMMADAGRCRLAAQFFCCSPSLFMTSHDTLPGTLSVL